MKKIILSLGALFLAFTLSELSFTAGETGSGSNASVSTIVEWEAESYKDVTKIEMILDLKGGILDNSLRKHKERISFLNSDQKDYQLLSVRNINKYEEYLILRIKFDNGNFFDFNTFNNNLSFSKFNDINLIKHNGKIKAKVVIYANEKINTGLYKNLKSDSQTKIKSIKYLYLGKKSGKIKKIIRNVGIK